MNTLSSCRQRSARLRTTMFAACVVAFAVTVVGCKSAQVGNPVTEKLAGNEPQTQLEFWHTLAEQPVTSNDEAFHGVLLYLDQKDPAADYAGRVALLKERKMLPDGFKDDARQAIRRGTLAVVIVRALQIKGGLVMHVFGPTERYATRELIYRNVYPPSTPRQTFSGAEFVGVMGRIEDYSRVNPAVAPAAMLPGEVEQMQKAKHETPATQPAKQP